MRKIDLHVIVIANEFYGILEDGHHAQPEQIDFDDAHVGAVFFVPLHDYAAGHAGGFEGDDGIELPLADHHATRVLPKMAWVILNPHAELKPFGDAWMLDVIAGIIERMSHRVGRSLPFKVPDES